ncbi:MAG TPA: hypothetical protein VM692_05160, partial [Gammaproteobacteria bacterium]|nr:hypothetical protein [Gammaproteobacteria bacterium]
MGFRLAATALLLASTVVGGCATPPEREPALHTLKVGDRSDTLVVMLPGMRDRAEQFLVAGFVDGDTTADDFDVVVVEPEFSDYMRGTIVDRLRTDVIGPA